MRRVSPTTLLVRSRSSARVGTPKWRMAPSSVSAASFRREGGGPAERATRQPGSSGSACATVPAEDRSAACDADRLGDLVGREPTQALGAEALWNRGDEEIGLAMPPVWCDAVESRAAADSGRMLRVHELYKGDLLEGFHMPGCAEFQHWLDAERAEAKERASAAAWGLACIFERDQRFTDAGMMAKRAVRYVDALGDFVAGAPAP